MVAVAWIPILWDFIPLYRTHSGSRASSEIATAKASLSLASHSDRFVIPLTERGNFSEVDDALGC